MEYTIFNTIFILNISRSLGQSDKLICYHAENIFFIFVKFSISGLQPSIFEKFAVVECSISPLVLSNVFTVLLQGFKI